MVKPSPAPAKITIDKKVYDNKNYLSVRLAVGNHAIKIEKNGYKTYETVFKIGFLEKKEIAPQLELTEESKDRKEIERVSNNFTEAWYTYETQTSKDYLEKIKPFMTEDFYEGTYYISTKRPQDFKGQVPLKTTIESVEITSYSNNKAGVIVTRNSVEPTTGKKYNKRAKLDLTKEGNKWLVSYLSPIL